MFNSKISFFIIGTQKAGTTSLYNYLKQHPDIYFSEVKELKYFIDSELFKKGISYLNTFFYRHKAEKAIGTSHVHMLPCPEAPKRVFDYNPDAKLIVVLREPVSRATSAFNYAMKNNWEKEVSTLSDAFYKEKERAKSSSKPYDLLYFNNGLYYHHLSNWRELFPKNQFLIITNEQLKNNTQQTVDLIFSFLNVDSYKIDFSKKYNIESKARIPIIQDFIFSNSKVRKRIGTLLPGKFRVWIRSRLFAKLVTLNSKPVDKKIQLIEKNENNNTNNESYEYFFKEDLKMLEQEYNIKLQTSIK